MSISCVVVVKPSGPHHCPTCIGSVHAPNTNSRRASIVRVVTISRPAGNANAASTPSANDAANFSNDASHDAPVISDTSAPGMSVCRNVGFVVPSGPDSSVTVTCCVSGHSPTIP